MAPGGRQLAPLSAAPGGPAPDVSELSDEKREEIAAAHRETARVTAGRMGRDAMAQLRSCGDPTKIAAFFSQTAEAAREVEESQAVRADVQRRQAELAARQRRRSRENAIAGKKGALEQIAAFVSMQPAHRQERLLQELKRRAEEGEGGEEAQRLGALLNGADAEKELEARIRSRRQDGDARREGDAIAEVTKAIAGAKGREDKMIGALRTKLTLDPEKNAQLRFLHPSHPRHGDFLDQLSVSLSPTSRRRVIPDHRPNTAMAVGSDGFASLRFCQTAAAKVGLLAGAAAPPAASPVSPSPLWPGDQSPAPSPPTAEERPATAGAAQAGPTRLPGRAAAVAAARAQRAVLQAGKLVETAKEAEAACVAVRAAAGTLSNEAIDAAFAAFDENGNGRLHITELRKGLATRWGVRLTFRQCGAICALHGGVKDNLETDGFRKIFAAART